MFLVDERRTLSGSVPAEEVVALEDAVAFFTRMLEIEPESSFGYFMRAKVYRERGQLDEAMHDLDSVARLSPPHAAVHIQKAAVLAAKHQYEDAIREADAAIRLAPNDPLSHCWRGWIRRDQRENDDAISSFTKAIRSSIFFHGLLRARYRFRAEGRPRKSGR